ncbi:uncharacterized protein LOC113779499 isoform X2 [Coffea eugenioides]|uniref:uncharacterized protein LOC113779499 isoform X2 n=1 Tax=Coffea eugenioides TaxID=49369 RepID=UPI000F615B01|nr:uncharacterized protein LOC113779499 isoform X2 [Coffea eugenioides]
MFDSSQPSASFLTKYNRGDENKKQMKLKRRHLSYTGMKGGNNCQENLFFGCTSASLMVMEGETIWINVKNKPSSGTGMLSAAGLLSVHPGTVKAKTLSIAPPPVEE